MNDEQFEQLKSMHLDTSRSIDKISEEQKCQSGKLEDVNGTVSAMSIDMTKMQAHVEHLKERAAEDRERDDKMRKEMETKVEKVHIRANEIPQLRGEFDNHTKDNHATVAAETKTALDAHVQDANRHSGEAPGGNGRAIKTAGIAAGGGVGIWGILELVKALFSGSGG